MRRTRRPLLALIALVLAAAIGYGVNAISSNDHSHPSPSLTATADSSAHPSPGASTSGHGQLTSLSSLPEQAQETVALIKRNGPFPYPRNDGVVFHNNEHLLPAQRDGYYREYTVPTPSSRDRGARRIITGAGGQYYYTGDHYEHFIQVDITR